MKYISLDHWIQSLLRQSPEMLDLLRHKNIGPGTRFEVCKKMVADGSVEIKMTNNRQLVSVSGQVANQLRVVYDNKNR